MFRGLKICQKFLALVVLFAMFSQNVFALPYNVNLTSDESDANPGDSTCDVDLVTPDNQCTLRAAVEEVNLGAGSDTIDLTTAPAGTITVNSGLAVSTNGNIINGDSDVKVTSSAFPEQVLSIDGNSNSLNDLFIYGQNYAVTVNGDGTTINDSYINNDGTQHLGSSAAIKIAGDDTRLGGAGFVNYIGGTVYITGDETDVNSNYFGITPADVDISPGSELPFGAYIEVAGSSAIDTYIGNGERNVIGNFSNATQGGIYITNSNDASNTYIYGNYIGVQADGENAARNVQVGENIPAGVTVGGDAHGNVFIGTDGSGNVISGSAWDGISIKDDAVATVNIENNLIGTDYTGLNPIPNDNYGIITSGSGTVNIGPTRNIISGNGVSGIAIGSAANVVNIYGNYIGLDINGDEIISNGNAGIGIWGGVDINIGSLDDDDRNVISGNARWGIITDDGFSAGASLDIVNNYIGLDADGLLDRGNGVIENGEGITISSPSTNLIKNNVISDNCGAGIYIEGGGVTQILGNVIGPNADQSEVFANGIYFEILYGGGILANVNEEGSLTIGSNLSEEANIISGNYGHGIAVLGANTVIKGNTITNNIAGDESEAINKGDGIVVMDYNEDFSSDNIVIGGEGVGDENVITGNEGNGIYVLHFITQVGEELYEGAGINGLSILGNYIGTNADGDDLGNGSSGIYVYDTENSGLITGLTIGSEAGPNIIKYNSKGISNKFLSAGTVEDGSLNSIDYNVISNNVYQGIGNIGSPSITNNTIQYNGENGILSGVYPGSNLTPVGFADDVLSEPTITGNTFDYNGLDTDSPDIGFLDSAASNADTLYSDNTFGGHSFMDISQGWYGAVEVLDSLYEPITSGVVVTIYPGIEDFERVFDTYSGGAWGPEGFDYNDITTWPYVYEYVIDSAGVLTSFNPISISAVVDSPAGMYTTSFSFDGEVHEDTGNGLPMDIGGRYQIAEVIAGDGDPVCGNGDVEDGEECDDGNAEDDDGCSATCQDEGGGGGTLIFTPPPKVEPPVKPPVEEEKKEEEVKEEIKEPEKKVEEAVSTVEDTVTDTVTELFVGTETGVKTEVTAEVTTEETPLPPPTEISEVDTDAVYSNSTYASQALALIASGPADKANEELRQVYGFDQIQENQTEQAIQIAEKELGDAVVFGKKPGEIVTIPRISNLNGTVGSNPAILALSKPNEEITIELTKEPDKITKHNKKSSTPVITITGTTDDEGKAVLSTSVLSDGKYSATIYTTRNGSNITGKTVKFQVSQEIDQEFQVKDLNITEEDAHERVQGEAGDLVTFLLGYLEKFDPEFIAKDYLEYSRTGGTVYVVQGRVNTLDNTNKMVYLAYQSVTFGSAVISDAGQNGSFKMIIPKALGKGDHKLTAYAYDPKQAKSTSQKKVSFQINK